MKTVIIIVGLLAAFVVLHFSSIIRWDGSRDIFLTLEPRVVSNIRVLYRSDTYQNLDQTRSLGADWPKFFPSSSLDEAVPTESGIFVLRAQGSGQKSLLKSDYEYWLDGFFIRIIFPDGSAHDHIVKISPVPNASFTLKLEK